MLGYRTCLAVLVLNLVRVPAVGGQTTPSCQRWHTQEFFRRATATGVAACLEAGADPMAQEAYFGRTPLHMAAMAGSTAEVFEVLLAAEADVNARDRLDYTPLRAAVDAGGEPAVIEVLLAAGADPNLGMPLHSAADRAEDADVINMLIEAGADLEVRDRDEMHTVGGRTPLHIAVLSGADLTAIEALLAAGADVDAWNTDGGTPLHMAKMHPAQAEVAAMLLAAGADVNARAVDNLTPLLSASTPALFPSYALGGRSGFDSQ